MHWSEIRERRFGRFTGQRLRGREAGEVGLHKDSSLRLGERKSQSPIYSTRGDLEKAAGYYDINLYRTWDYEKAPLLVTNTNHGILRKKCVSLT
jgi:hypothetical protein